MTHLQHAHAPFLGVAVPARGLVRSICRGSAGKLCDVAPFQATSDATVKTTYISGRLLGHLFPRVYVVFKLPDATVDATIALANSIVKNSPVVGMTKSSRRQESIISGRGVHVC